MRRRHNIALATIACLGTVYLVAQHRQGFQHGYGRYGSHSSYDAVESNTGIEVLPSDLKPSSPSDASPQRNTKEHVTPHDSPAQGASENGGSTVPSVETKPPPSNHEGQTVIEAEYTFQQELELLLPLPSLQRFSEYKPHNYVPDSSNKPKYAYATFLATRNPSLKDPYFLAIHSLIYRLLWSPKSRSQTHPFIVFVADFVTKEQRALLSGAGAIVRELAPVPWSPNVPGVQARWKDLFAKLNMWRETEFSRILFLDADAFPLENMDAMFDIPPLSTCIPEKLHLDDFLEDGPVCEPYVFAGIPQDPFNTANPNLNVGSMVFTPSLRMHKRLLQNYVKTDKYDCRMAEQAFLNWQFGPDTAFPATKLEREWGGFFPKQEEEGKLKVVHEKIWVEEKGWMREEWVRGWRDMIAFYEGEEFVKVRERDGRV